VTLGIKDQAGIKTVGCEMLVWLLPPLMHCYLHAMSHGYPPV
jgi:hypothetical protein